MQRKVVGHDTTEFALVAGVLGVDVILESTSWDCMFSSIFQPAENFGRVL